MPASQVEVIYLCVDQGMGTLVKIYQNPDGMHELTSIAVLDLGSKSGRRKYAEKGVDTVVKAVGELVEAKKQPHIDLITISHQDDDHWNLFKELIAQLESKELNHGWAKTTATTIMYGGVAKGYDFWKKPAKDCLDALEAYFKVKPVPWQTGETHYADPPKKGKITDVEGVTFRLLASGVVKAGRRPTHNRNSASAVIAIEFGKEKTNVIMPGDCTADTLQFINNIFNGWTGAHGGNPVQPCRALGVPHHGSLVTFASEFVSSSKVKDEELDIGREFARRVRAENVVASAGMVTNWNHPYKLVMEILGGEGIWLEEWDEHTLVWYDTSKTNWVPKKTIKGYWSTYTNADKDDPGPYEPTFTIDAKGQIFFTAALKQKQDTPLKERYPAKPRSF